MGEIRGMMPEGLRALRKREGNDEAFASAFLDERWDCLGESQLRKWIRSPDDVGKRWCGDEVVDYYLQQLQPSFHARGKMEISTIGTKISLVPR